MLSKDLLFAMNEINERYLEDAKRSLGMDREQPPLRIARRASRTLLLAAVISLFLIGTAFAAGLFSLRERRPAAADETYAIRWADSPSGNLIWHDLKYVFAFDGPKECRKVKFRPGWLPFEPVYSQPDSEGFYHRLVSEGAPETTEDNFQPYMVSVYYAPQFSVEDGAMLLMYQTPDEIIEERWGDETVLKFTASQHFEERVIDGSHTIPAHTLHYAYVIRFSETEGYIVVTAGTSDMETVEHVARELEIRPTDELVRSEDFENHAVFIDVAVG